MTLDQFYQALRDEFPWNWWYLDSQGQVRIQFGEREYEYCPLAALATQTLGMTYSNGQVDEIADELDVDFDAYEKIIRVADNWGLACWRMDYRLLAEIGIFV